VKKILPASIFLLALAFLGCGGSAKNYRVDYVDRNAAFLPDQKSNPFMLVIEITEDGRLSLNKIQTGAITDLSDLSEKLEAIFNDREKVGIDEREVIIDRQGKVKNGDLEKLIKSLADVKASPIRIIKNNL
jgi:biopolymer transport protein ExbD